MQIEKIKRNNGFNGPQLLDIWLQQKIRKMHDALDYSQSVFYSRNVHTL